MKTSELTKEIKTKIETFTYDGIDDAIKLAEEHGTPDFFDKFLGELQLRCVRYNSDHVCSQAKFFNLGMRGMAMYFKYRALLGLVNIACKGSKAYVFRNSMKKIELIGHIWQDGIASGGNVDLKYITNFGSLTDIEIEEAGTISNLELINNFKYLSRLSICGPLRSLDIPYSLRDIPLISTKLSIPAIKWECELLENLSLQCIEDIENLQFIADLKNLKSIDISFCKINSLEGIPSSIENFRFQVSGSRFITSINDSEFEYLRNLKKLKIVNIVSTNSDFSFLADLYELEELTISGLWDKHSPDSPVISPRLFDMEKVIIPNLSNQKKIRSIDISNITQNLDFLEMNQEIELINIGSPSFNSPIQNIKGLQNCNKIKHISIIGCKELVNLNGLEACKELDITLRNTGIENLDGLKGCSRLSKFGTYVLKDIPGQGASFSSTDVETFSDGTNDLDYVIRNNTLYISECNNLIDISGIKNATNLMGLSIKSCKNLKNIKGIETLQNLYEIDFSGCSELEEISIVKNFPKLRSLNLSGCKKLHVKPVKYLLENEKDIEHYLNQIALSK
jgi:hypothetical protein